MTVNNKAPTEETTNWKAQCQAAQAEAQFWQMKYFEQLMHSTQVISQMARPILGASLQQQAAQAMAMAEAKKAGVAQ